MNNRGISRLAGVLDQRMKNNIPRTAPLEFGTIQSNMSLKLDNFAQPFPQGEYFVCRVSDPLSPGDRVLVAWVGVDPVVIDVVVM